MTAVRLDLDLPADPLELGRRLADRPGVALWWDAGPGGPAYVACDPVETSNAWDPEPSLSLPGAADQQPGSSSGDRDGFGDAPRWIGLLPYEAARDLERPRPSGERDPRPSPLIVEPVWNRYAAVARVTDRVVVFAEDAPAARELAGRLRRTASEAESSLELAEPLEADRIHKDRIRAALELIARGELYQVNLARRLRLRPRGDLIGQLRSLVERVRAPFSAALRFGGTEVLSTSPELFLSLDRDGILETWPIKGTRPRGRTREEDLRLAADLDSDPKERAELAMVVDVERNDLGRIAVTGSVRVQGPPRVVTCDTVHHRVAVVSARLKPGLGREALLRATLPSGSVTGAPKIRAMEVIRDLEAHRRGLYTGALGTLMHDGRMRLAMAIRCLVLRDGEAHYFAGGGIVAESRPDREVEETRWKALQLGVAL